MEHFVKEVPFYEDRKQTENSSLTSRVYKMSWRARFFSLFLLLIGSITSIEFLTGVHSITNYRYLRLMIMGIVAMVFGAIATAFTFTSKITISDNAIELRDILHKKRLLISEIRGRQEIVHTGRDGITSTWKLVPKDDTARALAISNSYAFDNVFYEWLNKIPVLYAEDTD